jgi:hypothetical protein
MLCTTVKKAEKEVIKLRERVLEARQTQEVCRDRVNEIKYDLERERSLQLRTRVPGEIASRVIGFDRQGREYRHYPDDQDRRYRDRYGN